MGFLSGKEKYVKKYTDEELEEIEKKVSKMDFDKSDIGAMFFAAIITFLPPILLIFAVIYFIGWLMFFR